MEDNNKIITIQYARIVEMFPSYENQELVEQYCMDRMMSELKTKINSLRPEDIINTRIENGVKYYSISFRIY